MISKGKKFTSIFCQFHVLRKCLIWVLKDLFTDTLTDVSGYQNETRSTEIFQKSTRKILSVHEMAYLFWPVQLGRFLLVFVWTVYHTNSFCCFSFTLHFFRFEVRKYKILWKWRKSNKVTECISILKGFIMTEEVMALWKAATWKKCQDKLVTHICSSGAKWLNGHK